MAGNTGCCVGGGWLGQLQDGLNGLGSVSDKGAQWKKTRLEENQIKSGLTSLETTGLYTCQSAGSKQTRTKRWCDNEARPRRISKQAEAH